MTLSENLLQSLESLCTDRELVAYNLNVFGDGQMFLFFIR